MFNFTKFKYQFSEDESDKELRFKLLLYGLLLGMLASSISLFLIFVNVFAMNMHSILLNFFLFLVSFILLILLQLYKNMYHFVLYGAFFSAYIVILLLNLEGTLSSLRLLWFIVLLVVGFLIGSTRIGIIISSVIAITVLILFSTTFASYTNRTLLNYFEVHLILTIMLFLYTKRSNIYASQLKEQNVLLDKLASIDTLTGVYNRRFLFELANKAFQKAKRTDENYALMAMDLDYFKNINDTYGHSAGDQVLTTFANVVKSVLREGDLFGRTGGEEFMIVITDSDVKNIHTIAEKIRTEIEKTTYDNDKMHITVSIGVTFFRETDTLEDVMIRADKCLYHAKKNGRNQIFIQE